MISQLSEVNWSQNKTHPNPHPPSIIYRYFIVCEVYVVAPLEMVLKHSPHS